MNRPHFPIGGRSRAGYSGRFSERSSLFSAQDSGLSGGSQGTEIENLRRLMRKPQPLTDERIRELRDRVANGEFLTREAAESTAGCMLDDAFDLDAAES